MASPVHTALISRQELEKLSREHIELKVGDRLKGKVQQVRDDGKAVVDFGKFQSTLELKVPVQKGDVISVVVAEKGKQIKLKLENIKSDASTETRAAAERSGALQVKDNGELKQKIASMVQKEIKAPANRKEFVKPEEAGKLHRDVKDALDKLQNILKSQPDSSAKDIKNVKDIKSLSSEIKSILNSLESYGDALDVGSKIAEPIKKLDAAVRSSGFPLDREAREILSKLVETADRLANLKHLENLPQIKKIVSNDLKPNLQRLKEIVDQQPPPRDAAGRQAVEDLKKAIDGLLKQVDNTAEGLPDKVGARQGRASAPDPAQVAKQISQLKGLMERAGIPLDKEAGQVLRQLSDAAAKLEQAQTPTTSTENQQILQKEIKPNLQRLQQIVQQETSGPLRANQQSTVELKQAVETLLNQVDRAASQAPPKEGIPEIRLQSSVQPTTPDAKEVARQVADLKHLMDRAEIPINRETRETLRQISEAAAKLEQVKPGSPEAERIVENQLKPNLLKLQSHVQREIIVNRVDRTAAENLQKAINSLIKQVDSPPPSQTQPQSQPLPVRETAPEAPKPPPAPVPPDARRVAQQVLQLKRLVENAPVPLDGQTQEALQRLSQAAAKLEQIPTSETSPQLNTIIENEIKPNLIHLKALMNGHDAPQPQKVDSSPGLSIARSLSTPSVTSGTGENVRQAVDQLLSQLEKVLEQLPQNLKNSARIETLQEEIRSIREILGNRSENLDAGNRIVRQVEELQALVDKSPAQVDKEMEAIVARLTEAADKISRLERPDQLPQIKAIIESEINPNLSQLREVLARDEAAAKPFPTAENRQMTEAMKQQVDVLRQEVEAALAKIPAHEQSARETRELLEHVDSVLGKMSDFSFSADSPQFAEDIETLFENIKLALKQLRFNLLTGRGQGADTGISQDMQAMLSEMQLNFKPENAAINTQLENAVSQQLQQLRNLVEFIRNSDLPLSHDMEKLVSSLNDMIARLEELSGSQQWQKVSRIFQENVKPALQQIKEMFTPSPLSRDTQVSPLVAAILNGVESLQLNVDKTVTTISQQMQTAFAEFLSKAEGMPGEVKDLLSQMPQSLQTPENLSQFSESIDALLSKFSVGTATTGDAPLPAEARQILTTLRNHFTPLDISESTIKLAPKLKSLVDDSGIFFEKKMQDVIQRVSEAANRLGNIANLRELPEIRSIIENDLKPNLLAMKEFLDSDRFVSQATDQETINTVKKAVDELLNNISSQQNRAVDSQTQQQQQQPMQYFSFNIPIKDEKEAQLKVFYNKNRQKEDEEEFKLSLLLDMDRLGEIRTDFAQFEKNLMITFYVKNHDAKEAIEENLFEIKDAVEPDFNSLRVNVHVSQEKIAQFQTEASEPEIISKDAVDVKV